ncbi:hypothetical protein D4764_08G0001850 [Takifugu flavidus]|uniref:Uncharacterized protein n=1 Tax=Takifugu flavidus TaxID=433684 RepID=A0A5C6MNQ4_9TELE|nr:hypothetical protein D4764_08G0001850 [Takifugu flavidus]
MPDIVGAPDETTNGVLGDLCPVLDQGITELLDTLRINLVAPDGPKHNVPEELPAYSSHMRSAIVVDQEEPRSHCSTVEPALIGEEHRAPVA